MNLNELIEKYKKDIKKINESYLYDDKELGEGIIEGLNRAISDLEQLKTVAKDSLDCDTDTDCVEYFKNYVIGE